MPIDVGDLKSNNQAQANLRESSILDFQGAYPDIATGTRFYDILSLLWEVLAIDTQYAIATCVAAWVNDDNEVTQYHKYFLHAELEAAQYIKSYGLDSIADQQIYYIGDMERGTILSLVSGSDTYVEDTDFTFDPDTCKLEFSIMITGQHFDIVYKQPLLNRIII